MSRDKDLDSEEIELISHKEEWSQKFTNEKELLLNVFNGYFNQIEHIGSTSVPGLDAKPIIDIAVLINDIKDVPEIIEPLSKLEYLYKGEYDLPGRHFFVKGNPRQFHLHIVDGNTEYWKQWITFREILRGNKNIRIKYQELKKNLAMRYLSDRENYTKGKSDFINTVLKENNEKSTSSL